MAGQSLAMGEAFGKGFQYGKRKISSMSNEEFNKLDFRELSESLATDYKVMIPSMKKSLEASDELQRAVFDALGKIILTLPDAVAGMFSDSGNRAGLDATTTETSFSQLGSQITQVRAGSGLGDIRKQQERSREQNRKEGAGAVTQLAKANRLAAEARARRKTADEARTKAAQLALQKTVARTGVVTSQRKAGQSQVLERNNLIRQINTQAKDVAKLIGVGISQSRHTLAKAELKKLQAKLIILLKRYSF